MTDTTKPRRYRPTESKYKGGAHQMYVTYDLDQRTRSGAATYPKIKRVYIAGYVKDWTTGRTQKKSGREVTGVRIEDEQTRAKHHRRGYSAGRGQTEYDVSPANVEATTQHFVQVVELPEHARNARLYTTANDVPEPYRHALQRVR